MIHFHSQVQNSVVIPCWLFPYCLIKTKSFTISNNFLRLTCICKISVRDAFISLLLSKIISSSSWSSVWFSKLSLSVEFKTLCSFSFTTLAHSIFSIKACCSAWHCSMLALGGQVTHTTMMIRDTMDHSVRTARIHLQVFWAELDLAIMKEMEAR